jgi:peptide/nickel transport system substrate-binding protein
MTTPLLTLKPDAGRRTPKRRRGSWLVAMTLAMTSVACGGDGGDGGGGAGGTVVVGKRTDFSGFNTITNSDQYTDEVIKYALFTPLVQYDAELGVRPWLAESWDLEGDTAVVFHLRNDVKWHDGQPVTAEDVKYTFDVSKDSTSASNTGAVFLGNVASATVVDPQTIRFSFTKPHPQALEDFWWAPMPKHLLQNVSPADMRNAEYNRNPVGSGPYKFVEWQPNQRLVLESNPDFPEALGGPGAAQRIVFRVIPEPATLLTEMMTGGVHVNIDLEPDQVREIEGNDQFRVHAFPGRTVYFIGWNNTRAPFDSPEVRRAMTLAIDRQEIIDALVSGYGDPAVSPVPPYSPVFPDGVQALPHDPAQARQILESAGWRDSDGDGILDRNGQPFRFTLSTSDRPRNRAIVEAIQSQLREVGVDAQIETLEFQTLLAQHRSRDFDAIFTNWVLDNFQMAAAPFALFHSSLATAPGTTNRSAVADPQLDRALDAISSSTDDATAASNWRAFHERLQALQPFTFMFWLQETAASSAQVEGVEMDQRGELASIADWTL